MTTSLSNVMETQNMKNSKDILRDRPELKEMPYGVPTGYFDELRQNLMEIPSYESSKLGLSSIRVRKFLPYVAIAASLLILALVTIGLVQQKPKEDFYTDQQIEKEYDGINQEFEEGLNEEDIIEYLIYTGVSTNVIAMVE